MRRRGRPQRRRAAAESGDGQGARAPSQRATTGSDSGGGQPETGPRQRNIGQAKGRGRASGEAGPQAAETTTRDAREPPFNPLLPGLNQ
jgi:hypothetical protein